MDTRENNQDPLNNTLIGKYRIRHKIGYGTSGSVYLADYVEDGQNKQVAIKIFSPDSAIQTEKAKEMFCFEASDLMSISCSCPPDANFYIPKVHELCSGDPCFYVMDVYMSPSGEVRNLHEIQCHHKDTDPPYTEENLIVWFMDIARTLQFLHRQDKLHRDIKPTNIVLASDGHAVLVDYGSIVSIDNRQLEFEAIGLLERIYDRQLLDSITGTRGYIPPEITGIKPLTTAADVYSFGATFWELLFNEKFDPENDAAEVIVDEFHRGLVDDIRWLQILPKMLCAKPYERVGVEGCLSTFEQSTEQRKGQLEMKRAIAASIRVDGQKFDAQYDELLKQIEEYFRLIHKLKWESDRQVYTDEFVISAIYDKYRREELKYLKSIYENKNQTVIANAKEAINKQDALFMSDFEDAGLKPLADVLFDKLNALWGSAIDDSGNFTEVMKAYLDERVSKIRRCLSYQAQFVFGKYRHIHWSLDSGIYFSNRRHSPVYRGARAADRLFVYERTIASYNPDPDIAILQLNYLRERNLREALAQDEILNLRDIWGILE